MKKGERGISKQDGSLTVRYSNGEKEVKICTDPNDDTPEIKAILEAFTDLQNHTDWKKTK